MGVASPWDPDQYRQFADERSKPFFDLISMIPEMPIPGAVDLGCGTGELTALAADHLGVGRILGIDNSSSMLEVASEFESDRVSFELGDIGKWTSDHDLGLVLASASLHWVPDHAEVLGRWRNGLTPGGCLAVQVPANADSVAHGLARELAGSSRYRDEFGADGPPPDPVESNVLSPEAYSRLLFDLGFGHQQVVLKVYPHVLGETRDVVEWMKGTSLTRFREVMSLPRYEQFLRDFEEALLDSEGDRRPYFYPFKRILMVGVLGI